jgi:hypothetical protein
MKFEKWSKRGLYLPYAFDALSGKPSITLLFNYVVSVVTLTSVISLHFDQSLMSATIVTITLWVLSTIFYMLRKLTSAKIDISEQSIELNGDKDEDQ